jgi:predicted nucleic acid binding AN1-type Zn finger protein
MKMQQKISGYSAYSAQKNSTAPIYPPAQITLKKQRSPVDAEKNALETEGKITKQSPKGLAAHYHHHHLRSHRLPRVKSAEACGGAEG